MKYNVYSITIDQLRDLIRAGDDSTHSQIRIKVDGEIFISKTVAADDLSNIKGRFETFDAGNGYVGPAAADDSKYISRLYGAIQSWIEKPVSYIDIW